MQRFRLLGFYLVGVVGVVGLAVWGVSLRKSKADGPQPPSIGASQGLPTTATTGTERANLASAVRNIFSAKCVECHGSDLPKPKGRFGYVLDLERLAGNAHLVVPFKPGESKLWQFVNAIDNANRSGWRWIGSRAHALGLGHRSDSPEGAACGPDRGTSGDAPHDPGRPDS
jgi:hypothetical protein